jgi:hypothetical protein
MVDEEEKVEEEVEDDKSFNWADVQNPRITKTDIELLEEELSNLI